MAGFRLVQVSDTHISRHKAHFQDNWEAFVAVMRRDPPDMIVVTGDLCFDAIAHPDDLAFARAQMARLPVPWRAIPGNHDIGDQPPDLKFRHPVDDHTRALWLTQFGADWWAEDHGGWRIIGLNAMLFDSGLASEAEQWGWFESALNDRGGRPVLLFVHKPLFIDDVAVTKDSTMHYAVGTRQRLLDLARRHDIRVIGSGHLHRAWEDRVADVQLIWAPAASFVIGGDPPRVPVGVLELGFVTYVIAPDSIRHAFVTPPELTRHDMAETVERLGSSTRLPPKPWIG